MTGERWLWGAVFLRALCDLAGLVNAMDEESSGIRRAAFEWITSSTSKCGSFRWVCQVLDLDPSTVRRRILILSPAELRRRLKKIEAAEPDEVLQANGTERKPEVRRSRPSRPRDQDAQVVLQKLPALSLSGRPKRLTAQTRTIYHRPNSAPHPDGCGP